MKFFLMVGKRLNFDSVCYQICVIVVIKYTQLNRDWGTFNPYKPGVLFLGHRQTV